MPDEAGTKLSESLRGTLASVRDLTASANDMIMKDRVKVEKLLDGADVTRARLDRVLYQADQIAEQASQMIARNKTDIQRTVSNVRDATDWADKLVQKIFANPFVLSPLYKPTAEDARAQSVYDTALVFSKGAQELNDTLKTLDTLLARAATPEQQQEVLQVKQNLRLIYDQLNQTSQLLAESLKPQTVKTRR